MPERTVEVVNSTLAPPTTCHAFTFTIPRTDVVSSQVNGADNMTGISIHSTTNSNPYKTTQYSTLSPTSLTHAAARPVTGDIKDAEVNETTYYGVTMTVWTHADKDRTTTLKECKRNAKRTRSGTLATSLRHFPNPVTNEANGQRRRSGLPWKTAERGSRTSVTDGDITASETEAAISDSDFDNGMARARGISMATRASAIDSLPDDAAGMFGDGDDIFWMPYALTLRAFWTNRP